MNLCEASQQEFIQRRAEPLLWGRTDRLKWEFFSPFRLVLCKIPCPWRDLNTQPSDLESYTLDGTPARTHVYMHIHTSLCCSHILSHPPGHRALCGFWQVTLSSTNTQKNALRSHIVLAWVAPACAADTTSTSLFHLTSFSSSDKHLPDETELLECQCPSSKIRVNECSPE